MQNTSIKSELAREMYGEKVQRGIFRPVERYLHTEREDRMQEGMGMGFEQFKNKAENEGVFMDDPLCVHVVKLRATDFGRHLVRGGQKKRDALDVRNFHEGKTSVLHLDGLPDESDVFPEETDRHLEVGLAEEMSRNPTAKMNSAIDLLAWLDGLSGIDRELLGLRLEGYTLMETAATVGMSTSATFHRLKTLGKELAERAGILLVKKPRKTRAPRVGPALDS